MAVVDGIPAEVLLPGRAGEAVPPRLISGRPFENRRTEPEAVHQLDRAVRNTRVLARAAVDYVRDGKQAPKALVVAVRELSEAVRELARQLEEPGRASAPGETARRAARRATALLEVQHADLATNMLVGQVRSTAVDLMRGAGMEPTAAVRAVDDNTGEHKAPDSEPEDGPHARP